MFLQPWPFKVDQLVGLFRTLQKRSREGFETEGIERPRKHRDERKKKEERGAAAAAGGEVCSLLIITHHSHYFNRKSIMKWMIGWFVCLFLRIMAKRQSVARNNNIYNCET